MGAVIPFVEVHAVDHCNNNCRWCHNYSPLSKKKEYSSEEYFSGLDILVSNNIDFSAISIMGGEPFLHSDLEKFIFKLISRYQKPIMVTTNGFWLTTEDIKSFKLLWKMVAFLKVSRYPVITKRLGGEVVIAKYFEQIKGFNENIIVEYPDKSYFNKLEFFEIPHTVQQYCWNSGCTALLTDDRIARCGAGAYMHLAPNGYLPDEFRQTKDMFYNLKEFDSNSFWLWKNRYPMDACHYCSFSQIGAFGTWKVCKGKKNIFEMDLELEYHLRQLSKLILLNDLESARKKALLVAKTTGEDKHVYNKIGDIFKNHKMLKEAGDFYKRSLQIDPSFIDAARNMKDLIIGKLSK